MKKKFSWQNILFIVVILLLIIPQTGKPIKVGFNKVKMLIFSPSAFAKADQPTLQPFDYQLRTLDGASQEVGVGRGKVTFISYWATWCPPCIAEMPSIQELYNRYGDQIDFVLITQEAPETVEKFITKKKYTLPIYNPRQEVPEILAERSIPTNYIIDQKGNIVIKEKGVADWNSTAIHQTLDNLLAEQ